MRNALIALLIAAAPLAACASAIEHKQVSRADERRALQAAETAYAEAHQDYTAGHALSADARMKAYNALTAAYSALDATRNAFETDGAPTFMDTALNAKRQAEAAKAAAS